MSVTVPESKRLLQLEKVIKAGQQTFVEVGIALAEIRDSKLYQLEHDTFEDYCRERWGWSKPYCTQLITASKVVRNLPEESKVAIATESQARELAKAEPDQREEILRSVAAKGPVTAKAIREQIQEAVEVEKPRVTIDAQWKAALGKTEVAPPELTPLQEAQQDLDYLLDKAVETLSKPDLNELLDHLHAWIQRQS